ncbi:hypothetical protein CRYUN_Cryun03dG0135200 [Craigia yunnanensis]
MHDILREFALSISKEEKIVTVSDGKKGVEENGIRRCSIEVTHKELNPGGKETSQLRSLFLFVVDEISESSLTKLPYGLKLLRVLDLEDAPINELPKEFGDLFNLRYLNLTRTQVKLQNLRHLTAFRYAYRDNYSGSYKFNSIRIPPSICRINSLQVLSFVEATDALIKRLKAMTQLTTLGLAGVMEAHEKELCSSIGKMEHLHHLQLFASSGLLKMDALSVA